MARSCNPEPRLGDMVWISAGTLALGLALALSYPVIYGGDTIIRIVNLPRIRISYQLPLLQILLRGALVVCNRPFAVWFLMAGVAAAGATGLYALAHEIAGRRAALAAAVLYGTHPFILYYSRVPYQEPLLAALVFWGFCFLFRAHTPARLAAASAALGLASLTRYEGWLASALAAVYFVSGRRAAPKSLAWAALLFGWAPALWIVWNRGLAPAGTFLLEPGLGLARLYRPYFIMKSAVWWSQSGFTVLALAGLATTVADGRWRRDRRLWMALGFLALYLGLLVFSAHGIAPDPVRLVTEREAYVLIGFLALSGGLGAVALGSRIEGEMPRLGRVVACGAFLLVTGHGLARGVARIAAENLDPELRTDYDVGRFLAAREANALVLARPLPRAGIEYYLRKAEASGGAAGRRRAEEILAGIETAGFDYQRVVVYSFLGKARVVSGDSLRGLDRAALERFLRERRIAYAVVFSDFTPCDEHDRALLALVAAGRSPHVEVRHGSKGARIYTVGGS